MTDRRSILSRFLAELRRRRVVRASVVYAVVAWALVEIADTAFPHLGLPAWSVTLVLALSLAGFPLCVVLAWAFELTPEGVRRTRAAEPGRSPRGEGPDGGARPGARLGGYALAGLLGVAAGLLVFGELPELGADGERSWSSVAVLPFADLGPSEEQAYFGAGIAEELTHALAGVEGLRVAARTSAFHASDAGAGVREIGRDLDVDAVLEGSVRRGGDTMRITVQLVDAEEGFHIFSETYDRSSDDVFAVQEEIARSVVRALGLEVPGQGRMDLVEAATNHPEAYDYYLRGRRAWHEFSADGYREAIPYFERAIEVDSTYARAWAGLADAYTFLGFWGNALPEDEWVARAETYLERALELDPTLGEAYASRASIVTYTTDGSGWREGEDLVRTAAALSPRYATAHAWIAWSSLEGRGDVEEALAAGARAHELDPIGWPAVRNYARPLLYAGHLDEAIRVLEEAEPHLDGNGLRLAAYAYAAAGRHVDAELSARRMTGRTPESALAWVVLAKVRAVAGDRDGARDALARARGLGAAGYQVGLIYGLLGEMDEAYRWLERGGWTLWDRGDLQHNPLYQPMRADPRWDPLFERIKEELDVEG